MFENPKDMHYVLNRAEENGRELCRWIREQTPKLMHRPGITKDVPRMAAIFPIVLPSVRRRPSSFPSDDVFQRAESAAWRRAKKNPSFHACRRSMTAANLPQPPSLKGPSMPCLDRRRCLPPPLCDPGMRCRHGRRDHVMPPRWRGLSLLSASFV
jgi:hypothetical protein